MENNNQHLPAETISIDFEKLFSRLLSKWWLFLIGLILVLGMGRFYLRYATFEYSARAILLIKDAGRSGNISAESFLLTEAGMSGNKAMDNEIQILKSLTLMEKVVERKQLQVLYYRQGKVKESQLYTASPFLLDSLHLFSENPGVINYLIDLEDYKSFLLKKSEEDPGLRCNFGVPFGTEAGRMVISLNPRQAIVKGRYRLNILPIEYAARNYKSELEVQRIGDQNASSVLQLSMSDQVPEKARDMLNTLIDIYNEEEIKDENKVLENTLVFIDKRVASLVNELDSVEGGIQRYKSNNKIISDDAASSLNYTLSEIREAVQEVSTYEIQKSLLESLEALLLRNPGAYDLIPANLIAESPVLSSLVNQYNDLVIRNKQIALTASAQNPARMVLEEQIVDLRKLILETIQNQQKDLQIPVQEIETNIADLKKSMSSIPGIEKRLLEKMRTQAVKENLFLYLLQKREEAALSKAVTAAKTRTIDRARAIRFPTYPRPKLIMIVCGILGLLVPLLIVLLLYFLDNKIDSEETIEELTSIPILGRIAFQKGGEKVVVKHGSRTGVNEMFRLLRTNLNFLSPAKKSQTILLSSSISGEGKTFIALNLGITLALTDKKVILLGMDLRKPKLQEYLGASPGKGITNYLVGQSELDDIVQPHPDHPNLSYITSGPTPPNPAELILSDRMEALLLELSNRYDYVLIDTPPMGLVSDALLLRKYVDNILIVVRQNLTRKIMIQDLEVMRAKNELQQASIIFNGINVGKSAYGYGRYHYGYHYGYQQGYYEEEK